MKLVLSTLLILSVIFTVSTAIQVRTQDPQECATCTFLAHDAYKYYILNRVIYLYNDTEIYHRMIKDCETFADPDACVNMAYHYGQYMIGQINSGDTADQICGPLKLCPVQPTVPPVLKHHHHHTKKIECKACHYVFSKAEKFITNGQTDAAVEVLVDQECNDFGAFSFICKKVVHTVIKDIVRDIKNHVSAENTCKHVHMC